jgi:hypothetical protein
MSNLDVEIIVEDPTAPEADSPAVASTRTVEIVVSLLLLTLAVTLGIDNYRTGISWDSTGPQAGYFPFYLSVILAGASLYGLAATLLARGVASETFVTRAQLRRVLLVFVPTMLFCFGVQYLGIYVASFLLIAGFMRGVGKIAWWKSLATAVVFTVIMFVTFDIAFDVIMPKGPPKRLSADGTYKVMEAWSPAAGFAVLMSWKIGPMMVGLVPAFSSACCRGSTGRTVSRSCCR